VSERSARFVGSDDRDERLAIFATQARDGSGGGAGGGARRRAINTIGR